VSYFDWLKRADKDAIRKVLDLKMRKVRDLGKCENCGAPSKLVLHRLTYDRAVPGGDEVRLVCVKCHREVYHKFQLEDKKKKVIEKVGELLGVLGLSCSDENFYETPARFSRMLIEFTQTEEELEVELEEIQSQVFPSGVSELVVVKDIAVFGLCPHHLLPVEYQIAIGYLPEGLVLGLSKFSRIAELLSKKPALQEDLTVQIRDVVSGMLATKNVGVSIKGKHFCMVMRGVKQRDSVVKTSALGGVLLNDRGAKKEFFDLVGEEK
jgi:GTP cyclohydrolase I